MPTSTNVHFRFWVTRVSMNGFGDGSKSSSLWASLGGPAAAHLADSAGCTYNDSAAGDGTGVIMGSAGNYDNAVMGLCSDTATRVYFYASNNSSISTMYTDGGLASIYTVTDHVGAAITGIHVTGVTVPPDSVGVGGTLLIGAMDITLDSAMACAGLALPVAAFLGTPLTGPADLSVAFTDASTNTPTSWLWDFGDGTTSTSQNPTHIYTAPGTYTVSLTATNATGSDSETKVAYISVTGSGGVIEWNDAFIDITGDIAEWTITRGASPELTGGSQPGSATIKLINAHASPSETYRDDWYNPENASGPYYGFLRDGPRVWIGVNEDGTVTPDDAKDVYGLHAGRITDFSLLPQSGATVAPFAEVVTEDPLGWMGRQKVRLADSTTRSQADLRAEVLAALAEVAPVLPAEAATLPLSRADGLALNILDAINAANGTRHFYKPADDLATWGNYVAHPRTAGLNGVPDASIDAGADHVTGTSGWRISADGVINQEKASVEEVLFPPAREVWIYDALPLTVTSSQTIFAEFGDYVDRAVIDYAFTGTTPTVTLTPFGDTAKIELTSTGTTVFTDLSIEGRLVQRGSVVSVVIDDAVSQADSRGIRAGPDLTGDYLGTLTSATGLAQHIVWRFGNPKYRPTMTVANWIPEQFDLDLFDLIGFTSSELSITDRIFEIVGLTHHCDLAALDANGDPVVLHETTYVLQESRVQTETQWFTTDVSTSDGPDLLAY